MCVHMCICVCMCVSMYVCMCVHMYILVYVCVWFYFLMHGHKSLICVIFRLASIVFLFVIYNFFLILHILSDYVLILENLNIMWNDLIRLSYEILIIFFRRSAGLGSGYQLLPALCCLWLHYQFSFKASAALFSCLACMKLTVPSDLVSTM